MVCWLVFVLQKCFIRESTTDTEGFQMLDNNAPCWNKVWYLQLMKGLQIWLRSWLICCYTWDNRHQLPLYKHIIIQVTIYNSQSTRSFFHFYLVIMNYPSLLFSKIDLILCIQHFTFLIRLYSESWLTGFAPNGYLSSEKKFGMKSSLLLSCPFLNCPLCSIRNDD